MKFDDPHAFLIIPYFIWIRFTDGSYDICISSSVTLFYCVIWF